MTAKKYWHIVYNLYGYMPDEAPYCMYGTEYQAQRAVRDTVQSVFGDGEHRIIGRYGDFEITTKERSLLGGPRATYHAWYVECPDGGCPDVEE